MEKYFDINRNGCSIRCKLYCNDAARTDCLILAFHGFAGDKENAATKLLADRVLSKHKKSAVLAFDWPCHGEDGRKKLAVSDCMNYADIVLAYIAERWSGARVCLFASSFGGYMALRYIKERGDVFDKICLRCPAIKMAELFRNDLLSEEDFEKLMAGRDVLNGYERLIRLSRAFYEELLAFDADAQDYIPFADKMLIIHGTKDELVPIEQSEEFADKNVVELIRVEKADHFFSDRQILFRALADVVTFYFE